MAKHFMICSQFDRIVQQIKEGTFDKNKTEDRDVSDKY